MSFIKLFSIKVSVLIFLIVIVLTNYTIAQTNLTPSQLQSIELEKQNLRAGKISYEEYQKRYDIITASQIQIISKDSVANAVPSEEAKTDKTIVNFPDNKPQQGNTSPTAPVRASREYHGPTPGDELVKFGNQFYTGLIIYGVSTFALVIGAALMSPGLAFVGFLGIIPGTTLLITSFSHIRKAGKIMNMQERYDH
jgi:multisubunit Na+/H+ antiporter MnhB subunit